MKPGLTHRLRGHSIHTERRQVDTSTRGFAVTVESGRVDHVAICSCGKQWIHLPEPLTNKWRWT
jgi:hypothetical protein